MSLICTICARGGSKGLPGKNIRLLAGKPLIAWTIDQALASGLFDAVAVSSDDHAILDEAEKAGADLLVVRPAELATDEVSKLPSIQHCILNAEKHLGKNAEIVVDLQPTSPVRLPEDIKNAVALLLETGAESVITGQKAKCSPYFSLVERSTDGTVHISKNLANPVVRRQDAPPCYDMNGSIYVWRRDKFMSSPSVLYPSTRLMEMPEERSIDIDSEFDFQIAEMLLLHRGPLSSE